MATHSSQSGWEVDNPEMHTLLAVGERTHSLGHSLIDINSPFSITLVTCESRPATGTDSLCHRHDRPRHSRSDLPRFRISVAACPRLDTGPDGSCLRFGNHHVAWWCWIASPSYRGMVSSYPAPVPH